MLSNLKYVAVAAILSVGFAGILTAPTPAEAGPLKKIVKAGAFMAAGPMVAGPLVAGAPLAAAVAPLAVATAPLAAPVAIVGAKAAAGGFVVGAAARALLRR